MIIHRLSLDFIEFLLQIFHSSKISEQGIGIFILLQTNAVYQFSDSNKAIRKTTALDKLKAISSTFTENCRHNFSKKKGDKYK